MLRLYLLTALLGLASAQSSSVVNDWYSASASSSTSVATPLTDPTLLSTASSSTTSSSAASSSTGAPIRAVATISPFGNSTVSGTVNFEQADGDSMIKITYDLTGNTPNTERGIHIHENGSTNCTAANGHFNPFGVGHGLLNDSVRHAGDLGNIAIDGSGNAKGSLIANVTLSGQYPILGLTFVMHGGVDDGGKTGVNTSNSTGNSGPRLACGIINLFA